MSLIEDRSAFALPGCAIHYRWTGTDYGALECWQAASELTWDGALEVTVLWKGW